MKVVQGRFIRKASSPPSPNANSGAEISFPKKETSFTTLQILLNVIKALWPKKTTAHVSHYTGTSERTVRFWLAGETRMSVEAVIALLRTDEGYQILVAIMGDSKAEWWETTKVAHGLRQSRRAMKAMQKRIDELKALQSQIDLFDQ